MSGQKDNDHGSLPLKGSNGEAFGSKSLGFTSPFRFEVQPLQHILTDLTCYS
ncbi:hypothetical protein [Leptothoe spongobia]|uniref:Uncharacterized protein n=1 Tax=Leptothoe spongobia TAU-MAC 1115 TaxID=1967444 RepID=A0A947GL17_9CYAN|nr:hypothetical protein [Leptothoe spongobia]MBT9316977.1 hypothetical protein [Leptothoe spongobia TAU-MAC 1115]